MARSDEYWRKRQEYTQDVLMSKGEAFYRKMKREYYRAATKIEDKINEFYGRFASENGLSWADAKRILTSKERVKYQMTLDEYIEQGRTLNIDDAYLQSLKNASVVYRVSRYEALISAIRNEAAHTATKYIKGMAATLQAVLDEGYYRTLYELAAGTGGGTLAPLIDPKFAETVLSRPWAADGKTFSERIWGDTKRLVGYMDERLQTGLIAGEDKRKLIRDMAKTFTAQFDSEEAATAAAGRLIMTECAFMSATATQKAYQAQGVTRFQFIATLDEKTCKKCGGLESSEANKKGFLVEDMRPGVNCEPMHSRCRCHTKPMQEDMFEDIWAEIRANRTRAAREPKDAAGKVGKPYKVPADITYSEWQKQYGAERSA